MFSGSTISVTSILNAILPTSSQSSNIVYGYLQTIRKPNDLTISSIHNLDLGYYKIYMNFKLYSENFNQSIPNLDIENYFWSIRFDNSFSSKNPRVYIKHNNDQTIVNPEYPSAYLIYDIWVVWDIYFNYNYENIYSFSLDSNYDVSDRVLTLSQNARSIFTLDYCNVIKLNSRDEQEFLEFWFNDIESDIRTGFNDLETILNNIGSDSNDIINFLQTQFTPNIAGTPTTWTLWRLVYTLYRELGHETWDHSMWYKFFKLSLSDAIFNFDYYDPDDPLESYTINNINSTGLIYSINNLLSSINKLLLYDFTEKEQTKNSIGYQTGQNVSDSINSANGYGSVSDIGSNISGMGNMALIPSIFNGISSAFRWFTNETKNNLDMVPQTRGEQETISHYYEDNQAEAESILAGDSND